MTVNLKIFGSKGRCPAQSPGKVRSIQQAQERHPSRCWTAARSLSYLSSYAEEERGRVYLILISPLRSIPRVLSGALSWPQGFLLEKDC